MNKNSIDKIIIVFIVLTFVLNTTWIIMDHTVPKGDGMVLLTRSIYCYRDLKESNIKEFFNDLTRSNADYTDTPPAPGFSAAPRPRAPWSRTP